MKAYDIAGLVGGVAGGACFLIGLLLALLGSLRMASVAWRPQRGRIARGLAAGGLVLALCGAALFWTAELAPFRRAVDLAALPAAAVFLVLSTLAGVRVGRRRARRTSTTAPPPAADA